LPLDFVYPVIAGFLSASETERNREQRGKTMSCETKNNGGCQGATKTSLNEETEPNVATIQREQVALGIVDRKVSLLVAASAAMATGCEPCMDQIIPNLIEAGVADADIRRAVEIGQRVKDAAADYMKEVADVLAGTQFVRTPGSEPARDNPALEGGGCCG